jgi:hypothetical protein
MKGIAENKSTISVPSGDYYFGNTSLVIHHASDFTLQAAGGPGSVNLWFMIGTGVLVNESTNVLLDGLTVDYDPPAHYQGTIVSLSDDNTSKFIQAIVQTDPGFLDPDSFDSQYNSKVPGVLAGPSALIWNASDPGGFGAYASASWPPTRGAQGNFTFSFPRETICKDIRSATTDGTSCIGHHQFQVNLQDKVTAHIRAGITLHLLNSSRVRTQHTAIHGAPCFAITEYDGFGQHSYLNVTVGRRPNSRHQPNAMCGLSNPTGGRLCLGLISSNNDALHSSGCKHGPSFRGGELSYCLDDFVNVHSRAQVVFKRESNSLVVIDPRLIYSRTVHDEYPYGNVETLVSGSGREWALYTCLTLLLVHRQMPNQGIHSTFGQAAVWRAWEVPKLSVLPARPGLRLAL